MKQQLTNIEGIKSISIINWNLTAVITCTVDYKNDLRLSKTFVLKLQSI